MKSNQIGKVFSLENVEFDPFGNYEIQEITDMAILDEVGGGEGGTEKNMVACNIYCPKVGPDGDPLEE